jgi:hypothetical protein
VEKNRFTLLFPEMLSPPLCRNPVPKESRPPLAETLYGFPIRWSQANLIWLPYLPAVVSYHYPIFRNTDQRPKIVFRQDWLIKLGTPKMVTPAGFVELYNAIAAGRWPGSSCDLSPGPTCTGSFSVPSPE